MGELSGVLEGEREERGEVLEIEIGLHFDLPFGFGRERWRETAEGEEVAVPGPDQGFPAEEGGQGRARTFSVVYRMMMMIMIMTIHR